jgi:hypothetical protein
MVREGTRFVRTQAVVLQYVAATGASVEEDVFAIGTRLTVHDILGNVFPAVGTTPIFIGGFHMIHTVTSFGNGHPGISSTP